MSSNIIIVDRDIYFVCLFVVLSILSLKINFRIGRLCSE